jgi:hypothetical protein
LNADPQEQNNRIADPARAQQLAAMKQWFAQLKEQAK